MSRFNNLEFGDHFEQEAPASLGKDGPHFLTEAQSALEAGHFEEALRAFAKVLEFDTGCVAAWAGQVRMLIELGEFKEAKLWADKALEQFPTEAELLAAKAVALARTGDLQAALSYSDAAVESQHELPYIWLARADVLLARAEKRAEFCFEKAMRLAGQNWLVQWLACRICFYYQKFSRALRFAQKALELDASRAAVWLEFGRCQLALGLPKVASQSLEHARELDPQCRLAANEVRDVADAGWWAQLRGWWRRANDR